ncbi:MAG: ABC transporter permease [Peptoniphilaceae bacterium]|nr:ABC transporter permease [Peptoniphilaceae bacterium]MDD7383824.1 ABC transporter permease [Peptoniphilaceae bacterium]MDY3737599.1 ABC transporter permease [Peptoniphilaceae bacterium]
MKNRFINKRLLILIFSILAFFYIVFSFIFSVKINENLYDVNFENKFLSPSLIHPFGCDFMGRDMFFRSFKALSNSLIIGLSAAFISSIIAIVFAFFSSLNNKFIDRLINFLVDLCMGLPHLVLMILISFMFSKGVKGVTMAIALTHWPTLTRIIRAEIIKIRSSQYVKISQKFGKSKIKIAISHIFINILPSYIIGLILLFPHAIMHEASITFLGFGLPREMPAIGIILSESVNNIALGKWHLVFFPGLLLLIEVLLFDFLGETLKTFLNPSTK